MSHSFLTAGVWWVVLALVMAVGGALVLVLAMAVRRWARSGRARQALWRTAVLAVWFLLLVELTGIGPALGVWTRGLWALRTAVQTPPPMQAGLLAQANRPSPAGERGPLRAGGQSETSPIDQMPPAMVPAVPQRRGLGPVSEPPMSGLVPERPAFRGSLETDRPGPGHQPFSSVVPGKDRAPPGPATRRPPMTPRFSPAPQAGGQAVSEENFFADQAGLWADPITASDGPGRPAIQPSAAGTGGSQSPRHAVLRFPGLAMPLLATYAGDLALRWGPWLARIWLVGTAALLGWLAWNRRQLARLRAGLPAVGHSAVTRQLGLRRPVEVLESPRIDSPVAFGVYRPVLVVPAGFAANFDASQQAVMLAHELAHVAQRDPLWLLLADLLGAVLWWHPAVWHMRQQLRAASELAADESSLLVPGGPEVLAGCLVGLARRAISAGRLGWLSVQGGGFRSALGRRVERLLRLRQGQGAAARPGPRRVAQAGFGMLVALALVLSVAWVHAQAGSWQGETTMSVLRTSWQRWLAALAVAAFAGPTPSPTVAAEHPDAPEAVAPREGERADRPKDTPHHREAAERPKDAPPRGEPRRGDRERRPVPEFPPHQRELAERFRQLQEKAHDLEMQLQRVRPDSDDARELRERLEGLRREMREIGRQLGGPPRRLEGPPKEREFGPLPPEEQQRRMHHLRVAAENLRAAGMHELAERVLREAEGRPARDVPMGPVMRGARVPPVPELAETVRAVRELTEQVQRLSRQVEELRAQVHRLQRPEREEREREKPREKEGPRG